MNFIEHEIEEEISGFEDFHTDSKILNSNRDKIFSKDCTGKRDNRYEDGMKKFGR